MNKILKIVMYDNSNIFVNPNKHPMYSRHFIKYIILGAGEQKTFDRQYMNFHFYENDDYYSSLERTSAFCFYYERYVETKLSLSDYKDDDNILIPIKQETKFVFEINYTFNLQDFSDRNYTNIPDKIIIDYIFEKYRHYIRPLKNRENFKKLAKFNTIFSF